MKKKKKELSIPSVEELEAEIRRERYRNDYTRVFWSTIGILVSAAAVAVLVAALILPVLQIYGYSMTPNLENGDIVVSMKSNHFQDGDVVAFYYNNKILVKRVIATQGEWIDIDKEGNVFINGEAIEEPYLQERAFGDCDIELPYQVPDGKLFLMGDHRSVSVDSRSTTVGCVSEELIVGKLVFRVWPFDGFGAIE